MSVSLVFVNNKIEFKYAPEQNKIFIFDMKNDKVLPTYSLPNQSTELDKGAFIDLCLNIRKQIDKGRHSLKQ
jgi:Major royal jelly protein